MMKRSSLLPVYESTIAVCGLALGAYALLTGPLPTWPLSLFFALCGIGFLQTQITLPSGISISPALPLIMAGLLVHGLALACLVIIPGSIIRILTLRRPILTALFCAGQLLICSQVALVSYGIIQGHLWLPTADILSIVAATVVFDLVNVTIVTGRAALVRNASPKALLTKTLFRERRAFVIPYHLLTILTCLLYVDRGLVGLGTGLLCVLALKLLFDFQRDLSHNTQQARLDPLTEAFNPRFLSEWFEEQAPLFSAQKRPLTALFIDMDELKTINDRYGHPVGDGALRHLVSIMRAAVRQNDLLCRLGGDEFVIISPDVDKLSAAALSQRILKAVREQPFFHNDEALPLSVSIGSASFPKEHPQLDMSLVDLADRAMYLAKSQGRNRVCYARQLTESAEPQD